MFEPDMYCWNCQEDNLTRFIEINNRVWRNDLDEYVIDGCNLLCWDCYTTIIQNRLSVL